MLFFPFVATHKIFSTSFSFILVDELISKICFWHIRENGSAHVGTYIWTVFSLRMYTYSSTNMTKSEKTFLRARKIFFTNNPNTPYMLLGDNKISKLLPYERLYQASTRNTLTNIVSYETMCSTESLRNIRAKAFFSWKMEILATLLWIKIKYIRVGAYLGGVLGVRITPWLFFKNKNVLIFPILQFFTEVRGCMSSSW